MQYLHVEVCFRLSEMDDLSPSGCARKTRSQSSSGGGGANGESAAQKRKLSRRTSAELARKR